LALKNLLSLSDGGAGVEDFSQRTSIFLVETLHATSR